MGSLITAMQRVLQFLRLTDEAGNLSITNLAVLAAAANMFLGEHASAITELGPVAVAVLNYAYKRKVSSGSSADADRVAQMLATLERLRAAAEATARAKG